MNDASLIRRAERVRDSVSQPQHAIERQRLRGDDAVGGTADHKFHCQEVYAIDVLHRIYGDDVPMVECRKGSRLPAESLKSIRLRCDIRRQNLEGYVASERCV